MHTYARAGIVGARGYSGLELAKILMNHPCAELKACFAHDHAFQLQDYLPHEAKAATTPVYPLGELKNRLSEFDVMFLATPAETSIELAPEILKHGVHVIDLSGAFRLKEGASTEIVANYQNWYNLSHPATDLIQQAHYGLQPWNPEFPKASSGQGVLISNPGCYATASLMALIPLLKSQLIQPEMIVIDAKSGTTGAGRKAAENILFSEVDGECLPYKAGNHQHLPEIIQATKWFSGAKIEPFFTPHLLPTRRGIICGIYAQLTSGTTEEQVTQAYTKAYSGYPLAQFKVMEKAEGVHTKALLSLKKVAETPYTHVLYRVVGNKLYVFSLIDNLLKGAASQAVENMNQLFNLNVKEIVK